MKDGDDGPEEWIEVFAFTHPISILQLDAKLATEQVHAQYAKYEDEQDQEREKRGHVVYGAQHNHQLTSEGGHEANNLENAQQTEGAQNGNTACRRLARIDQH